MGSVTVTVALAAAAGVIVFAGICGVALLVLAVILKIWPAMADNEERGSIMNSMNTHTSGPQGSAVLLTNEQKLAKIEWLANTWLKNYDADMSSDPRNPSERDIAYDDAGFQILHILGKV